MDDHSVLVVEDDSTVRELLKYRLGKQYDVRTADNGEEALARIEDQAPDLIISDVMMPKMDGFSLYNALESKPETRVIPFIFLTARSDDPARRQGLRHGADDYIEKPFDMDHLLIRVSRLIERLEYYRGNLPKEEEAKDPLNVFLCHAKEDSERVAELYHSLEAHGIDPWMDDEDLLPGHDWKAEIRDAIHESHVVLVCLSQSSVDKRGYVQKEIKIALEMSDREPEGAIFIIPVRLEECFVPKQLMDSHWLDLFEGEGNLKSLLRALEQRASALQGVRAPEGY